MSAPGTAEPELEVSTLAEVQVELDKNSEEIQEAELQVQKLLRRQAALVHGLRVLQHRHLIHVLESTHLGYVSDKPLASMIVHRCLISWRAAESHDAATQAFLQSLVTVITHALDENELNRVASVGPPADGELPAIQAPRVTEGGSGADANSEPNPMRVLALCAYWLTMTSTLLALLNRTIPEHPSYQGRSTSGSQQRTSALHDDTHESAGSIAAAKFAELQTKLVSRFSNFKAQLQRAVHAVGSGQGEGGGGHTHTDTTAAGTQDGSGPTPAQVFRHSLDLLLLQAYAGVRDAVKKQIAPFLPACIQEPQIQSPTSPGPPGPSATLIGRASFDGAQQPHTHASHPPTHTSTAGAAGDDSARFTLDEDEEDPAQHAQHGSQGAQHGAQHAQHEGGSNDALVAKVQEKVAQALKGPTQPGPLHAWEELTAALQATLDQLRAERVPRILIKCLFKQLLGFIDSQLFNQLLLRPDCCSVGNARHVLAGLRLLDQWVMAGTEDSMMRPLYQELRHARQASQFLVTEHKAQLSVEDLTGSLCPALTAQQLYRLCTTCWDDQPPTVAAQPQQQPEQLAADAAAATPTAGSGGGADGTPTAAAAAAGAAAAAAAGVAGSAAAGDDDMVHVSKTDAVSSAPVADLVSGEVLESLKSAGGGVQGNGGLLITFLLDEWQSPIIAPEGSTAIEVLNLIESRELYQALTLPHEFDTPTCPRAAFAFVEEPLPLPAHLQGK